MGMPLLHLLFTMCAALMLASCVISPSPEEMQHRAEKNRWELAHWGDRRLPPGDQGEPVVLSFKGGKVSGHAGCNQYSAEITFGPDRGSLKVSRGITTRMACDPSHMEFESAFIQAFVFTFLTALFLGQLIVHHEHGKHDHGHSEEATII